MILKLCSKYVFLGRCFSNLLKLFVTWKPGDFYVLFRNLSLPGLEVGSLFFFFPFTCA